MAFSKTDSSNIYSSNQLTKSISSYNVDHLLFQFIFRRPFFPQALLLVSEETEGKKPKKNL